MQDKKERHMQDKREREMCRIREKDKGESMKTPLKAFPLTLLEVVDKKTSESKSELCTIDMNTTTPSLTCHKYQSNTKGQSMKTSLKLSIMLEVDTRKM